MSPSRSHRRSHIAIKIFYNSLDLDRTFQILRFRFRRRAVPISIPRLQSQISPPLSSTHHQYPDTQRSDLDLVSILYDTSVLTCSNNGIVNHVSDTSFLDPFQHQRPDTRRHQRPDTLWNQHPQSRLYPLWPTSSGTTPPAQIWCMCLIIVLKYPHG